jgi:hypothetical protein
MASGTSPASRRPCCCCSRARCAAWDYFETLADAARRAAMDDADRAAFFLRHDTVWV